MSVFDLEKIKEELSVYDPLMPCVMKALRVIGRLCKEGQKLEAQRNWLAEQLNFICHSDTDCVLGCPDVMNGNCRNVTRSQWIEAAKEATNHVDKL